MFGGDDEDADFLSPTGGAKLASLFGLEQEASGGNESFQYTAPKQPRKSSTQAPATPKLALPPGVPAVLFATAVQTFRYLNGQYVKQGKLGAAVLGNHTTKEYKLLLYLSQQKQVTAAKIHVGFVFTVQPNNYCTFYDDQRHNWSLMFESEKTSSDFCKEVCLAKANSATTLDSIVFQDLFLGEGQTVENGDSLEVAYTGWLLQNHTIGQMFDSCQNKDKLLRLKVGAGKVIKGWEKGMMGMKKAGRRLIVIPPNLAYGSKGVPNRIPSNSTLVFEVELRRVKFSKDSVSDEASASSRDSAAPSPATSPIPSMENLPPELPMPGPGAAGEPPLRAKSDSLSEQLANPDATKAKLISRMAKMGQPMLPFLTGAACQPESSDSELEDNSGSRLKDGSAAQSPVQLQKIVLTFLKIHLQTGLKLPAEIPDTAPPAALLPVLTTVAPQSGFPGGSHAFQPYSYSQTPPPSQLQTVGQIYHAQTIPYVGSSDLTSFLMTEARQHSTEVRLSVGRVADKVDQLGSKIDELQRQGSLSTSMSGMSMETSMIMSNIQRIIQENECFKKEIFEKSCRIEEQNHKIGELINQNQRYMEQSNLLLEKRNDSLKSSNEQSQFRLLQAEQDKVRLTEDLASSTARLAELQLKASAHQQTAMELQTKLKEALQDSDSQSQRITVLESQLKEVKEAAEKARTQYRLERQQCKQMELKVTNMEQELQGLTMDKERLEHTLLERKNNWQAELQRRDKEVEELRKASQQELENLQSQLSKAMVHTDSAASEQLLQLQTEVKEVWKRKCEQMLAYAKKQHSRELVELGERQYTQLKMLRDSEEHRLMLQSGQQKELQVLQERYAALERQEATVKDKLERQVAQLEEKLSVQQSSGDTAREVKRVMNGVFHSLRGEFDLTELYSGQAVLAMIVSTIKSVTLQLLSNTDKHLMRPNENKTKSEEEEISPSDCVVSHQNIHENGEKEIKGEKEEEEYVTESVSHHITEIQADHKEVVESMTQAEAFVHFHSVASTELKAEGTTAVGESGEQQKQVQHCVLEVSMMEKHINSADPDTEASQSLSPKDSHETVSEMSIAMSSEVDKKIRGHVGEAPPSFGPPANPPPSTNSLQNSSEEDTSLNRGIIKENGEKTSFQTLPPTKPTAAQNEDDEEEEMSLKGCPPPALLFGEDDDDDDDLDWLN
ncbi:uncharacterized protein V6R79_024433 [Siganus canaliculatus]